MSKQFTKLRSLGKAPGFASRTYAAVNKTPFLQDVPDETGLWRSPVTQRKVFEDLLENRGITNFTPNHHFYHAVSDTMRIFQLPEKVKMLHLNDVFKKDLNIWSKSPGLPWRQLGYTTKGDIRDDPSAVRSVRKFWHFVKLGHKIDFPDCLAYVRAHTCERGSHKVRAVWGYPATVTFGEAVFALPLIEAYKSQGSRRPMAYGYEMLLGGMKKITNRFAGANWYTGIDFRKFDKTVPAFLIRMAFDILALNIDFVRYQDYGIANAEYMIRMYEEIQNYFINTKIRCANGQRFQKSSGIASGSYFTQLVGSVINCILIHWMSYEQFGLPPRDAIFLGDDSLISSCQRWDLEFCQELAETIGMTINMNKSQVDKSLSKIKFLGYSIGNGQPEKPRNEWVAALLYPERPDQEFADVQSRALGIFYANMGIDDYIHRLCKYLVTFEPFVPRFTRNFERGLEMAGIDPQSLDPKVLPTKLDFAIRAIRVD